MPSPFPGMDPYLEGPEWAGFHSQLAVEITRQLGPRLRPRYVALTERRYVFDAPEADEEVVIGTTTELIPDGAVVEGELAKRAGSSVVVAEAPLRLATAMPRRVPQFTVEIRDVAQRRLVTDIEILSPSNKRGSGRKEYLARREKLLLSSAHLMAIDLLRGGRRVPMQQALPPQAYFVLLSRAQRRPMMEVWPIALEQSLPVVP